ncbi:MAG: hypothetical protein OEZ58_05105 [Gammaproteobacteria bacterium]|nr:hypothetical protein [Gammaproteobacteria bacterium]MDH5728342.1 hypothetical protein [Gammaproteobacteria bacterium]
MVKCKLLRQHELDLSKTNKIFVYTCRLNKPLLFNNAFGLQDSFLDQSETQQVLSKITSIVQSGIPYAARIPVNAFKSHTEL